VFVKLVFLFKKIHEIFTFYDFTRDKKNFDEKI